MAAASIDPLSPPAPPTAAPELGDYTQFVRCEIPLDSGAARAYRSFIRPFSDDATARRVLRAIEHSRAVNVTGGRLDADHPDLPNHFLEPYLIDMAVPLTALVLEYNDSQRPRAYLVEPPMIARLSACSHLRLDKSITIDGVRLPALCVYSGALLKFETGRSQLEQVLDQTATYLAKYLVWLRTRNLYRRTREGAKLVQKRRPGEPVSPAEMNRSHDLFWEGYWSGPTAPSGPAAHLDTIKPNNECWCWSGLPYGGCCRSKELTQIEQMRREFACAQLIPKLMAAIHAKSGGGPEPLKARLFGSLPAE
jgi:hypothetical protein